MWPLTIDDDRSLRPYEESDAPDVYALIASNRAMLARWMGWAAEQTLQDTVEFIGATRREREQGTSLETVILHGQAIVGAVGLNRVDHVNSRANIGYWLAREAQGGGTVTLAVAALIDWALRGPWQLHRLEIRAGTGNAPSRAVPERLGFRFEGVSRGCERVGDAWLDHAVYGLLAEEWSGGPARPDV